MKEKTDKLKKMFESVGHPVKRLHRISVGCVNLKGLRPGEYRRLKQQEVKDLKKISWKIKFDIIFIRECLY